MGALVGTLVFAAAAPDAYADWFANTWYDGTAEISTYELKEMRYGEPREGRRVMVFVTEPLRRSTKIKPDSRLPASEKVNVLKLNDIRSFTTGIYNYNVMTSAFAAVEEKPGIPLWATVKVALTSQEWCGTVFERSVRDADSLRGVYYSYFESEGEGTYAFGTAGGVDTEEGLWLRIRELRGDRMAPGETVPIAVIPSAWSRRKAHVPTGIAKGTLHKGTPSELVTRLGALSTHVFTWTLDGRQTRVWVEAELPRRILAWEEPDGSSGLILASRREPYWRQNRNADEHLRDELLLSHGRPQFRWPWEPREPALAESPIDIAQ